MRTIAISLADNDFGHTFRPLLEGLKPILQEQGNELNEAKVEQIIRSGIMYYYLGYQHRFDLEDASEDKLESISKYLNEIKVLFDEAAETEIATKDHDGGSWYLEVQSGTVSGY